MRLLTDESITGLFKHEGSLLRACVIDTAFIEESVKCDAYFESISFNELRFLLQNNFCVVGGADYTGNCDSRGVRCRVGVSAAIGMLVYSPFWNDVYYPGDEWDWDTGSVGILLDTKSEWLRLKTLLQSTSQVGQYGS